jgi:hypothetical protein
MPFYTSVGTWVGQMRCIRSNGLWHALSNSYRRSSVPWEGFARLHGALNPSTILLHGDDRNNRSVRSTSPQRTYLVSFFRAQADQNTCRAAPQHSLNDITQPRGALTPGLEREESEGNHPDSRWPSLQSVTGRRNQWNERPLGSFRQRRS